MPLHILTLSAKQSSPIKSKNSTSSYDVDKKAQDQIVSFYRLVHSARFKQIKNIIDERVKHK